MIEHGVHAWDMAALMPIIEEAGGRLTDWKGRSTIYQSDVIATNGRLHEIALGLLGEQK
jgi:histidinol-phosphatase